MYHHFMGRNLILGDIHSRYEKLMSVLSLASYDPKVDTLYALGDFIDRGRDAYMTLSFLMEQKNLKAVIGNHDLYLQNWLYTASPDEHWKRYLGGNKTIKDSELLSVLSHIAVSMRMELLLTQDTRWCQYQ